MSLEHIKISEIRLVGKVGVWSQKRREININAVLAEKILLQGEERIPSL